MISETKFRGLYDQYERLVRATIFYLARPNELDEIVQEVFLKIWQKAHTFKGQSELSTWIYRLSYNTAIDALRKKTNVVTVPCEERADEIEKLIEKDRVHIAIKKLGEKEAEILKLHYYVELQIDEIATMLEIPEGTVKSRLSIARGQLATLLQKYGITL